MKDDSAITWGDLTPEEIRASNECNPAPEDADCSCDHVPCEHNEKKRLWPSYDWLLQYFQQDIDHKFHLIVAALNVASVHGRHDLRKEYAELAEEIRKYKGESK